MVIFLKGVAFVTEEQLKSNFARNISTLRKGFNMTQAELAEQLNYSDKAVSKWERGESLPDVIVMQKMAELFSVTLNDLVSENKPKVEKKKVHASTKIIVPMLSVGLTFLVASIIFFAIEISDVGIGKTWVTFVYAAAAAFIVTLVFTEVWWGYISRLLSSSGIIWSLSIALRLTFTDKDMNFIFVIAAIVQVIVALWFYLRYRISKRKKEEKKKK